MTAIRYKTLVGLLLAIVLVAAVVLLLDAISPEELVQMIGVQNGYVVAFFVAILGGMSSFTSIPFLSPLEH